jgi:hypothetical protein
VQFTPRLDDVTPRAERNLAAVGSESDLPGDHAGDLVFLGVAMRRDEYTRVKSVLDDGDPTGLRSGELDGRGEARDQSDLSTVRRNDSEPSARCNADI